MASIKLGSLLSLGSGILKNALNNSQQSKSMAQDLLKTSKLELRNKKRLRSYTSDPLEFTNIKFPRDLGNTDQGHYMIFYIISNTHSKFG